MIEAFIGLETPDGWQDSVFAAVVDIVASEQRERREVVGTLRALRGRRAIVDFRRDLTRDFR